MATERKGKRKKKKEADSCWDGYSNYFNGKHNYKKGKNGDRVRDCKSNEEIAAMSSKKSAPTAMVEGGPGKTPKKPEGPKPPESTISSIKAAHKIKPKPKKKDKKEKE